MAQQYATDEAGNVWDVSGPQPVFVSAAGGAQNTVVGPNPLKVQAAQQGLSNDRIQGARTAQQMALDAAKIPVAAQVAQADASKATTEAEAARISLEKSRREIAAPDPNKTRRENLQRAIDSMRTAFAAGPLATQGFESLKDYLPLTQNKLANDSGNAAAALIGPALNLSASQLNTPGEVERAVGPYIPQSGDTDAQIRAKIQRLQGMADAMGGTQRSTSPADQKRQTDPRAVTIGNAGPPTGGPSGPAGYDVAGVAGGVGGPKDGGGGFSNAAGLAMAQKLSKAYTAGGNVSALNKLLRDNGYQEFTDPQSIAQIQKRGPLNFAPPQVDDSRSGLGRAIGDNLNNSVGAYATSAADALTAGNLDTLGGGQTKLAQEYLEKNNPTASLLGTVTGGALAAGGAELGLGRAGLSAGRAALAGDALYGGAYGAGSADGGNRLLGALAGATGGAVGGIAGRGVAAGAGRVLRGVQNDTVRGLRDAGVTNMTFGQAVSQSGPLGAGIKRAEDLMTGIPGPGTMVNARRTDSLRDFNQVAFDDGLSSINANTGGVIGEQGVDTALDATGRGYRDALDNVNVTRDPQFTGEYASAVNTGTGVARLGPEFESWAKANLDPLVANPQIDGARIQDFLQQTRKADFGTDSMGELVGRSVTGAEDAMRGLVARQAPDALPKLSRADEAYRKVQILKDAVNRARNGTQSGDTGLFVPSQLSDAAAANAKKFGNGQGTTRQPFFDLTRAAQKVLPSKVGDSGSAGRLLMQGTLGAAGLGAAGGGGAYATGSAEGAGYGTGGALALAALLSAGGTKAGQKALVKLVADRPDAIAKLGNKVLRGSKYGGIFGAPLIAPIATGIVPQ